MAEAKSKGIRTGYYQGKPVLVAEDGATVYFLPAPQSVDPEAITDAADEYDAGAEAESATTPETEGVTQSNA